MSLAPLVSLLFLLLPRFRERERASAWLAHTRGRKWAQQPGAAHFESKVSSALVTFLSAGTACRVNLSSLILSSSRLPGCRSGSLSGWMNGRTNERTNGWTDTGRRADIQRALDASKRNITCVDGDEEPH